MAWRCVASLFAASRSPRVLADRRARWRTACRAERDDGELPGRGGERECALCSLGVVHACTLCSSSRVLCRVVQATAEAVQTKSRLQSELDDAASSHAAVCSVMGAPVYALVRHRPSSPSVHCRQCPSFRARRAHWCRQRWTQLLRWLRCVGELHGARYCSSETSHAMPCFAVLHCADALRVMPCTVRCTHGVLVNAVHCNRWRRKAVSRSGRGKRRWSVPLRSGIAFTRRSLSESDRRYASAVARCGGCLGFVVTPAACRV
jgi:hypothetical protein